MAAVNVPDVVEQVDVTMNTSELNMKKKISFFTYALARGGTEKVVSILLQELQNDFDIYLVLTSNFIEYPIPEKVVTIIIGNNSDNDNNISRLIKLPLLAWRYYKFCKKNKIDISISFLNRPNYIACMLRCFGWKKKIFISERTSTVMQNDHYKNLKSKIGKFLVKKLYPKADLILPNSKANAYDLKKYFNINIPACTIYNPVNLKNILAAKDDEVTEINFSKFTYVMLGRFVEEKDHSSLIEAFSLLKNKNECQLLLIGHGQNENKIKDKIDESGLTANIILIDFVENPYRYLSKAHCLVLSSLQEGFPNVLIEALACSLPVISTDCKTGPRELLAPGSNYHFRAKEKIEIAEYGILVPVKNPGLLSQAMQLLYEDKTLAETYKSKALQRAKDFDIPVIIKEYKKIIEEN